MWIHWVWFMYVSLPLAAQLQCRRHRFNFWIRKILWRRDRLPTPVFLEFPCGLASKESTSNLIPGLGRSDGEGIGYPLQYTWASLVAQLVKNLPAKRETWVWYLGWEDPREKGKATHSSIWPGEFHGLYSPWGCKEQLSPLYFTSEINTTL